MRATRISILVTIALSSILSAAPALQEGPPKPLSLEELQARQRLGEAEVHAARGRYGTARSTYRKLAKEHPETEAGKIAERRTADSGFLGWADVVRHGPSNNRVDVVFMGEGYELGQLDAYKKMAEDMPPVFERQKTFREYYQYFNFQRAVVVSKESGVDEFGREYETALHARRTGTIQGHVAVSWRAVMNMLDEMPEHDSVAVVSVKRGLLGTGGAGVATIGGRSDATMIHEFGHAFATLGDEYTQMTSHRGATEARANISGTDDPDAVPWSHWLKARVRGIGVYRGADGKVKGAWRPTSRNCVMDNGKFFCPVCREELILTIYRYVDPIDSCYPQAIPRSSDESLHGFEQLEFAVTVMQPDTHDLEVRWWLLPDQLAPESPEGWDKGPEGRDRRERGVLPAIAEAPGEVVRRKRIKEHKFNVDMTRLGPGRYRLICRVLDDTLLRGEQHPWVLKDDHQLLQSERGWWISIDRK